MMTQSDRPRSPQGLSERLMWALTTAGGLGMAPIASGTFGTLPGLLLAPVIHLLPGWPLRAAALAGLGLIAVPIASWGERFFGEKDPGEVVIDEVVSMPLTAAFAPLSLIYLFVGFLLNRVLDIIKPPPARQAQALRAGWGIVVDDLISGVYAGLLLWVVHRYAGAWIGANLPGWMTRTLVG